jgi:hypothetical protein
MRFFRLCVRRCVLAGLNTYFQLWVCLCPSCQYHDEEFDRRPHCIFQSPCFRNYDIKSLSTDNATQESWPFLHPSLYLPLFLLSTTSTTANEAINYDSSGWRSSYGKPRSASIYIYTNDDQDHIPQTNHAAPVVTLFAGDEIEKSFRA